MVVYCNDDGSNTSPYETLAKAATTFAVAAAQAVAGEDILIGMDHVEDPGANITYNFAGTETAPVRVISINTTTEAYDKADNIQIDNNGGVRDIFINDHVKFYGVSLRWGDDLIINTVDCHVLFDDCELEGDRTSGAGCEFGATAGRNVVELVNTNVKFPNSNSSAGINLNTGIFEWIGGTLTLGATMPTALFQSAGLRTQTVFVAGVDLSALSSAIFSVSGSKIILAEVHECELHASVSLTTGTMAETGTRILMSGCDDTTGNKLYRMEYVDFWGSTVHDAATFRTTGGASDGTTPISWKMVSTGNAKEFSEPTKSPPIPGVWVDSTGTKTFKVNCLWDSATDIQNDEAWLEVEFLEASADTGSGFANDRPADVLAAPADQTTNAVPWTISPSMTNANEFELSVTVTVNRVGPAIIKVCLAKPSTTIFADPKVEIT